MLRSFLVDGCCHIVAYRYAYIVANLVSYHRGTVGQSKWCISGLESSYIESKFRALHSQSYRRAVLFSHYQGAFCWANSCTIHSQSYRPSDTDH